MNLNIQLVRQADFIRTTPTGELDMNSTKELLRTLAAAGSTGDDKPMLVDIRKTSSILKKVDVFELASSLIVYGKTFRRKTAILARDDDSFDRANFFELVAKNRGYNVNAFTSFEQTVYVNDIPSNEVSKWLSIEAERFRNPVLRLFHTELEAVYEEKNRTLDNDGRKMFYALYENLFREHNYGKQTTIGTVEHLRNPSLEKIRNYYNAYYVPNNMAIIMSGDFDPDKLIGEIGSKFSYMVSKGVPKYSYLQEVAESTPRTIDVYGPDAEYVYIGYRLPGAGTREAVLLNLTDLLLSNIR